MIHKLQNLIFSPSTTYDFLVFEGEFIFILLFHISLKSLCSQDLCFPPSFIKTLPSVGLPHEYRLLWRRVDFIWNLEIEDQEGREGSGNAYLLAKRLACRSS